MLGSLSSPLTSGAQKLASWPPKYHVLGVLISKTTYTEAVDCLISSAREKKPALATALAVHGVVEAARDAETCRRISAFEIVTPDGQPVRHALNLLYQAGLTDRVYGPTLMLRLCEEAARCGIGVYLYGSTHDTVERLKQSLEARYPLLDVVGAEPSLFRTLNEQERQALAARIAKSGAGIVFLGLGCPRQEHFAYENRDLMGAVLVCVGAAFDFHAGTKRQAPQWVQDASLEWLFRLCQEPRRLFRRYAVTNSIFLWRIFRQYTQSQVQGYFSRAGR